MIKYTREQLLEGLTDEDIETALKVITIINYRAAYGHNPDICGASGDLKVLLCKELYDSIYDSYT
jgi:hypothetical protein